MVLKAAEASATERGRMSTPLTSWKQIAGYLGKGVRTAQRWERDMSLPVRRPEGRAKGIVYALPDEIDVWLQQPAHDGTKTASELRRLRSELSCALAEIQRLNSENQRLHRRNK